MKRRLGIAQALIHHPKVIIVDEPTTGLDPEERIRFRNLLSEVSENDVTIILSTHIVGDISSTCNNMALMNRGQVSFNGSPQDMLKLAEGKVWRIMSDKVLMKGNEAIAEAAIIAGCRHYFGYPITPQTEIAAYRQGVEDQGCR